MGGPEGGIHDAGVPACPSCGRSEQVAAVPAVYRGGQQRVPVRVQDEDGFSHTETRTVPTPLAAALSPAPPPSSARAGIAVACLGFVLGLFGLGALVAGLVLGRVAEVVPEPGQTPSPYCTYEGATWTCFTGPLAPHVAPATEVVEHSYVWLAILGGAGLAVAAVLVVAGSRLRRRRVADYRERLARAERVWERAWYCARCGTVHFRPAPDAPSRALQLGEFRHLVWGAGGFGESAAKYPVL